jgi:formylglycine-generating enzyme required for sulfatase activity
MRTFSADAGATMATVADFRLDRFEVTVGRFRQFFQFLMGGGQVPPNAGAQPNAPTTGWVSTWSTNLPTTDAALTTNCDSSTSPTFTWTSTAGTNELLPINCVDWYTAFAFCAWDGGRLPTEAEWQYAATIDSTPTPRMYPWGGAAPDSSHAVYCVSQAPTDPNPCATGAPIGQVGSKSPLGDGPWGHADLAGNLWEWVLDSPMPFPSTCTSMCYSFQPSSNNHRGIRGGSYLYGEYYLPGGIHTDQGDTTVKPKQGIRCARAM